MRHSHLRILSGMRGDVLERPLQVLMLRQVSRKHPRLLTHHAQEAIVSRQHGPVEHDDFLIVVVRTAKTKSVTLIERWGK